MKKITKSMTCIVCPIGCSLTAVRDENGNVTVTGNSCPRGAKYATSELTNPVRTLTSVVRTENGDMLSVKTSEPISKELVREAAKALAGVVVKTPVHIGDVIVKDILGTGSDIVATKNIP